MARRLKTYDLMSREQLLALIQQSLEQIELLEAEHAQLSAEAEQLKAHLAKKSRNKSKPPRGDAR